MTSCLYLALLLITHFHKQNFSRYVSKGTVISKMGYGYSCWDLTQSKSHLIITPSDSPNPLLPADLLVATHHHPDCFLIHLFVRACLTRAHYSSWPLRCSTIFIWPIANPSQVTLLTLSLYSLIFYNLKHSPHHQYSLLLWRSPTNYFYLRQQPQSLWPLSSIWHQWPFFLF